MLVYTVALPLRIPLRGVVYRLSLHTCSCSVTRVYVDKVYPCVLLLTSGIISMSLIYNFRNLSMAPITPHFYLEW